MNLGRTDGEKNLSRKLEKLDMGVEQASLDKFEQLLDQTDKNTAKRIPFKWWSIGFCLLAFMSVLVFSQFFTKKTKEKTYTKTVLSDNNSSVENEAQLSMEDLDLDRNKSEAIIQKAESIIPENKLESSIELPIKKKQIFVANGIDKKDENATVALYQSISSVNKAEEEKRTTATMFVKKANTVQNVNSAKQANTTKEIELLNVQTLQPLNLRFKNAYDLPFPNFIEYSPTIQPIKKKQSASFGFSFHQIMAIPGTHETPFVSPFPTNIESIQSYGYGLFGMLHLNEQNAIRASFNYFKIGHRQNIEELLFPTGPDRLVLELYSNELRFGLDYLHQIFPRFDFLNINLGAGISYRNIINQESNNYYEIQNEQITEANILESDALSYKFLLQLERPIFKSFALGVEPYFIYQKRRARYNPSIFIADKGDFNYQIGIGLYCRM